MSHRIITISRESILPMADGLPALSQTEISMDILIRIIFG